MYFLKKYVLHSPSHYIGAVVLAAAMTAFRFFMLPEGVATRFAWFDSLSVAGAFTFLVGALLTVAFFGAFDLFGYVFSPGRVGEHKKYKSFAHYSQVKQERRSRQPYYFVPYYVVGALVFLVSFLFA